MNQSDRSWLSPTSAGRLIKCRASAILSIGQLAKQTHHAVAVGTDGDIAHYTPHKWTTGGKMPQDSEVKGLMAIFDSTTF